MGRHGVHGCLLQHVRFDNGSVQEEVFYKGIIPKKACHDWYETKSGHCSGDPFLKCREKCCYKDYCNKGNILDTNDQVSSSNEAVFISDGVVAMGLLLGVSLVAFSVNYLQNVLMIHVVEVKSTLCVIQQLAQICRQF